MSDGEHDEGNTWEAVLFAAKYRLDNLIAILDRNNIQIDGNTEDIMPLDSLEAKYKAFNWNVMTINGNDMDQIVKTLTKAKSNKGKPLMIIAKTMPGKGVSFMEGKFEWHGKPPKPNEAEIALRELHEKESHERGDWYLKHLKLKPVHAAKQSNTAKPIPPSKPIAKTKPAIKSKKRKKK